MGGKGTGGVGEERGGVVEGREGEGRRSDLPLHIISGYATGNSWQHCYVHTERSSAPPGCPLWVSHPASDH